MRKAISDKEVHRISISLLKDIADFCTANELKLFLLGGTLLGGVRDKKMIPWDDDVDVGLRRTDYDTLMRTYVPQNEHFKLLTEQNPDNTVPYMRLIEDQTESSETYYHQTHGIFVDIFPIDEFDKNDWQLNCYLFKHKVLNVMRNIARSTGRYPADAKFPKTKEMFRHLLVNLSAHKIALAEIKSAKHFAKPTATPTRAGVLNGMYGRKEIFDVSMWENVEPIKFENVDAWQPRDYDKYLTQFFGDWRTPVKQTDKHGEFYFKEKDK